MGTLRLAPLPGRLVAGEDGPDAGATLDRAGRDRLASAADPVRLVDPRARGRALDGLVRAAGGDG